MTLQPSAGPIHTVTDPLTDKPDDDRSIPGSSIAVVIIIIRKLANSKWRSKAATLRPSSVALCYSAAEYACPVWARSTHAPKMNPVLPNCCRIISGCLKPTHLDSVHILAGITPPHIRRTVACRMERIRQTTDARHQLFHHQPRGAR